MAVRRRLTFAILTVGATSIVAQIVLLRELIIVFYGNEISVGILLASWLLLGAAGSLISAKLSGKVKDGLALFCLCQLLLSAALPFLVVLVRHIKLLFGFLPGEIIPLEILAITGPVIILPVSFTLGYMFALGCKIFPAEDTALKIGRVYILESVGAAIGGLFASFIFIKHFSSIQILTGLAVLNAISCIALTYMSKSNRAITLIKTLSCAILAAIVTALVFGGIGHLDKRSLEAEWRPLTLLISKNSIYGNVAVTKSGSQVSFFTNGLHNFTVPDQLSREESVHFVFSQHEDPKDILIIGGGAGGLLREILKYKVAKIDYIELDPLIIELARKFLSDHELDDKRLNIINTDGRLFAKNASDAYDVVIISVPDPYTAQLNRFYTKEFFKEAKKAMRINGVLSIGVTSSENYISPELGNFLSSIDKTLKNVFADVAYIPGDTAYFMAASKKNILTVDHGEIASKIVSRNISTGFVSADYLFSKLSKERIDYMRLALDRDATIGTNHDFRPISYYYDMVLWSTYFRSWLGKVPGFINPKIIWSVFLLVYLLLISAGWVFRKNRKGRFRSMLIAIGTTGFSEIVFEIVVILSFQIIYGFLYYKLGLILTSFMIGIFLGSAYMTKRLKDIKDSYSVFIWIQISVVLLPLVLRFILYYLSQTGSYKISWVGSNLIFPSLPLIAGFIGGLQFPLGNKIYLENTAGAAETGGLTYGVDLIGACIGATLVSAFLIPIIGIFQTCVAVGLLNFAVLLALLFSKKYGDS